jgi:xanthine dehydrogenase YagR molybdenum-binding subunit
MTTQLHAAVGSGLRRVEGIAKVTGQARYAAEFPLTDLAYGFVVQSTIAKGRIVAIDASAAQDMPGFVAVLTHENAERLADASDGELQVLQTDRVYYRGQAVALVMATTPEFARAAADALVVRYDQDPHDVLLTADHPTMYKPEMVNPNYETDTRVGDVDAGLATAPVLLDRTYRTPAEHNNPMEPHASTAVWDGGSVTVYDSSQGVAAAAQTLATLFDIDPESVRVISEHVGGGFGSKGSPRPHLVLAVMAAKQVQRPVRVVLTRQMLFSMVGYRTPTIQRLRLGADHTGTLLAIDHQVWEQTSTLEEFAEQTATATRMMYRAPVRSTSHRLARLDVPTPRWMRAPGEAPGMFALESAMNELAAELDIDPVELRIHNDPVVDPETGKPWSSRGLVECLRRGADEFGWADRDRRSRDDGRWQIGFGVASSVYPARTMKSTASVTELADGRFSVEIAAADIGTGARTILLQVAADALGVPVDQIGISIGDSKFGPAQIAGGSMGTASWSWAVDKACRQLLSSGQQTVKVDTEDDIAAREELSRYAFGAQFVEARVHRDTGEVRIPRMVGVFAAGRIINPVTARSQLLGGMTMGLSMALHEESVLDQQFGDFPNHDLAQYHIASHADICRIDVGWIDEHDDNLNPLGVKGIGEIGIVGTAAAICGAVYDATSIRVRDLPLHPEKLLRTHAG